MSPKEQNISKPVAASMAFAIYFWNLYFFQGCKAALHVAPSESPSSPVPTEAFTEVMDSETSAPVALPEFMENPESETPVENDESKFFHQPWD